MKELRTSTDTDASVGVRVLGLILAFLVWAQLMDLITGSGLLWASVRSKLATTPAYFLADQLRQIKSDEQLRYLVIGNDVFLARVAKVIELSARDRLIRSPQRDIRDALAALQALEFVAPEWVIIQSTPTIWSTFFTRGPKVADIHLWKYENRWTLRPFPLEGVQLFFRTLTRWASTPAKRWRPMAPPKTLAYLDFEPNPVFSERIAEVVGDSRRVLWVQHLEKMRAASNRNLIRDFRRATTDQRFDNRFGRFIKFDQLSAVLSARDNKSGAD